MAKTSKDAYRHIREWSEFFKDLKWISEKMVDAFIAGHKQKKYLKQSLARLIKKGFIQKRDNKLNLTLWGLKFFRQRGLKQKVKRKKVWDGRWRLISFDVPGGYNPERDRLRSILKTFGFYQLHKSVWVCPNFLAEDIWRLIVKEKLDKYCKAMVVEIIEGDEELKKYFDLE